MSRWVTYELMAESRFPKPICAGEPAVRWVENEGWNYIARCPRTGSERSASATTRDDLLDRLEGVSQSDSH